MVLFTALSLSLAWSAEPVEVVQVRAQWTDVTARIAAGEVVVTTVDFNANKASFPAVGTWSHRVELIRTWRDPERAEGPGLNELPTKIVETASVAAPAWKGEYLYDGSRLRFAVVEDPERGVIRAYYDTQGKPVRLVVGSTVHDQPGAGERATAQAIAAHGGELMDRARVVLAFAEDHGALAQPR